MTPYDSAERLCPGIVAAAITVLVGLALWQLPIGHQFTHWSFDLPVLVGAKNTPREVVIIKMDEQSFNALEQQWPNWSRALHARLLQKLTVDQARLVVFDIFFANSEPKPEDLELAQAIKENGRVMLAGVFSPMAGFKGGTVHRPLDAFRQAAGDKNWGVSNVELDSDPTVRRHYPGTDEYPSLPWAAAAALKAPVTQKPDARLAERWLRYYGPDGTLPSLSYYRAFEQQPGYFKNKIVFIGGKPITRYVREEVDEFHTPYTHLGGPFMSGVEVEATTFLNLMRADWLTRLQPGSQLLLLLVTGALFGFGLSQCRPWVATGWTALGIAAVAASAGWLFWKQNVWFPWLIVVGAQIPCAWLCSLCITWVLSARRRESERPREPKLEIINPQLTSARPTQGGLPQWFPDI